MKSRSLRTAAEEVLPPSASEALRLSSLTVITAPEQLTDRSHAGCLLFTSPLSASSTLTFVVRCHLKAHFVEPTRCHAVAPCTLMQLNNNSVSVHPTDCESTQGLRHVAGSHDTDAV